MNYKLLLPGLIAVILLLYPITALANQLFYKLDQQPWEYNLGDSPEQKDWQQLSHKQNIPNAENYNYVWLRTKLPDIKLNHAVIYTNRGFQILMPYEFYLQGKSFFQNGQLSGDYQLADYVYSLVSLPNNWQGEYLYIRIYNNNHPILQDKPLIKFIGSYKESIKKILTKNSFSLILSLSYLIIGIIILQFFFFRYNQSILFYTGAGIITLFIYTIIYNPILSFLFQGGDNQLFSLVYYFNAFMMATLLSFYFSEILTHRKQLFVKLGTGYLVAGIIALIIYLINPYSKFIVIKIYNISLIIFTGISFYHLIKSPFTNKIGKSRKEKIKTLRLGFIPAAIGILLSATYSISYQINSLSFLRPLFNRLPFANYQDYAGLGLFFFMLSLIHVTGEHFIQINQLAIHDSLTELYNHRSFKQKLMQSIKKTETEGINLSLLMIDIDNFKQFNDSYGHQAGDKVLQKLARLLENNCRSKDTVARYGGEEFAIILPKVGEEQAFKIAQRLIKAVRNLIVNFDGKQLKITVSIGLSTHQPGHSKQDLIAQADHALYQAKRKGKDQIQINKK